MVTYLTKTNAKTKLDINNRNKNILINYKNPNKNLKTSSLKTNNNNNKDFDQIIDSNLKSTTISAPNVDRNEETEAKTTTDPMPTSTPTLKASPKANQLINDLAANQTTDEIDRQINCYTNESPIEESNETNVTNNDNKYEYNDMKDQKLSLDSAPDEELNGCQQSSSSSLDSLSTCADPSNEEQVLEMNDFSDDTISNKLKNIRNCDNLEEFKAKNKKLKYILKKDTENDSTIRYTDKYQSPAQDMELTAIGSSNNTNNNNININNIINGNDPSAGEQCESVMPAPQLASSKSAAQAVLVCENAQPLAERRVCLDAAAKVGRAVGRIKPSADNFIFDCKVLSRNHALLWFENQKFFLQDTRSSNGTFVNNQRLSPANEESVPREVFSGDVVQFGVDVVQFGVDNTRKVTHGCIIAKIKLYYPNGSEARAQEQHQQNSAQTSSAQSSVCFSSQQMYELSKYLSEAIHREQILENKLETLQRVVTSANESANAGWKSLVEEDRLLSRIETLQNKLEICLNTNQTNKDSNDSQNRDSADRVDTSDSSSLQYLREEMIKLIDDKEKYESAAKEAIQKALEEKLIVLTKVHEYEVAIRSNEEECSRLQEVCEASAAEINRLANCNDELKKEIEGFDKKLKAFEDQKIGLIEAKTKERDELLEQIRKLREKESENEDIINDLKDMNELTEITVEKMKLELEVMRAQAVLVDSSAADAKDVINETVNVSDNVNNNLNNSNSNESKVNAIELNLEEELLKVRLQLELSNAKCSQLSVQLNGLQKQTVSTATLTDSTAGPLVDDLSSSANSSLINGEILSTNTNESIDNSSDTTITSAEAKAELTSESSSQLNNQMSSEIDLLKELLAETRASKKSTEDELSRTVTELENLRSLTKQMSSESETNQQKLDETLKEIADKSVLITSLKKQMQELSTKMQNCVKDSEQIKCKIGDNEKVLRLKDEEISSLKVLLEEERKVQHKYASNYEQCRKQLSEQQFVAKQSQTEAELLRKKVYSCNEELRTSRSNLSANSEDSQHKSVQKELEKLQNESQTLQSRLHSRESELLSHKTENQKLLSDYGCLQKSFDLLKGINSELEARGDNYWKEKYITANCDAQTHQTQLIAIREQLSELKHKFDECSKHNEVLNEELMNAKEDNELFSYQSKIATACAIVPLFMLFIAVLMAYYPSVSTVTGTADL